MDNSRRQVRMGRRPQMTQRSTDAITQTASAGPKAATSQEDEDESDERRNYYRFNARSMLTVANRPPPKPPDFTEDGGCELRSLADEIGCTTPGVRDEGLTASSGAEDGAVAKGTTEITEVELVEDGVHDGKTTLWHRVASEARPETASL
ncbi:hypothetical protein PIB30_002514 [Stylosanthes scabra]|uniref:Uncharacterized protein n=1 Tax=Stylosanthes scabra TaxID=79078 RepID=A0ABU6Y1X3_9FABA|nr:hypothetical protein [Stylosanthes scabra]